MSEPFKPAHVRGAASGPVAIPDPDRIGVFGSTPDAVPPLHSGTAIGPDVGPFVPLLILALTMLAWFVFQAYQLRVEQDAMRFAIASQDKPSQDSQKLREALKALTTGTAKLAEQGNPGARLIVDELKKRGIALDGTIAPQGEPAQ